MLHSKKIISKQSTQVIIRNLNIEAKPSKKGEEQASQIKRQKKRVDLFHSFP
jgi:hypothetical protein